MLGKGNCTELTMFLFEEIWAQGKFKVKALLIQIIYQKIFVSFLDMLNLLQG